MRQLYHGISLPLLRNPHSYPDDRFSINCSTLSSHPPVWPWASNQGHRSDSFCAECFLWKNYISRWCYRRQLAVNHSCGKSVHILLGFADIGSRSYRGGARKQWICLRKRTEGTNSIYAISCHVSIRRLSLVIQPKHNENK